MAIMHAQAKLHLNLKVIDFHDNGNGTITIGVPCRPLSETEAKALESLFPNTRQSVDRLLDTEALIGAQATEADMIAPPKDRPYKSTINK